MSAVATWSGGIDSTAVIAQLLFAGWDITAVTLEFEPSSFAKREAAARWNLMEPLRRLPGELEVETRDGSWLWEFSPDGIEIPTRNRRILDHLVAKYPEARNFAVGEYVGCDTWVVRDHVGASDCDARALTAYMYEQYGMDYRLITLADYGESRYKSDRFRMLYDVLLEDSFLTTNCMSDSELHCGACYKCVERAAAIETLHLKDRTQYESEPREHASFAAYLAQMQGFHAELSHASFAE